MTSAEIREAIATALDCEVELNEQSRPNSIIVPGNRLKDAAILLHEDQRFYFDMLSCLTAVDNGEEAGTIDLIYHLYSIPFDISLAVMATVDRLKPTIATVSDIWRTANWHEREAFDLVGVHFEGHGDLRRILLPNDWQGHPLRKDYKEQEKYHGMSVVYDRDD